MNTEVNNELAKRLSLCKLAKEYIEKKEYDSCRNLLCSGMQEFPDAPEPHNLFGILLEKTGRHSDAMRHFRAAWDLDPTYAPAKNNLLNAGTFRMGPSKYFYGDNLN